MSETYKTPTAAGLDLPRCEDDRRYVLVGQAAALEVIHETPRAVLLLLFDRSQHGQREQWFPRSVLRFGADNGQEQVMGPSLVAQRGFVGRNDLWHWTTG